MNLGMGAAYWRMLPILVACYVCAFLDRQVLSIVAGDVKASLGLGDFQLSLLLGAAFTASYVLFAAPLGYLADKWSRPRTLCIGLLIWSAATIGCGFSGSFAALFAFRMLVGAGESAINPVAYSMIGGAVPRDRLSLALTIYTWGGPLGNAISLVLGGAILTWLAPHPRYDLPFLGSFEPWQIVFFVVALPGLVLAPLALRMPDPGAAERRAAEAKSGLRLAPYLRARWGVLTCIFVGFSLTNIVNYNMLVWTPSFLARAYGWSPGEIGAVFGALVIAAPFVGSLVLGTQVDRIFRRGVTGVHLLAVLLIAVIAGPMAVAGFLSPSPIFFWIGVVPLLAFLLPATAIAGAALQLVCPPALRGTVSGLFIGFINVVGNLIGPSIVGALTQFVFRDEARLGWSMAVTVGVSTALALPFFAVGARLMKKVLTEPEA
jgi:MFS family permease